MVHRLRRFFDVRTGEGLPVLLAFLYIASVVAAFLLAKPIRNSLFLREYGPYALVYVYAAVPLVLSLFVPLYSRIAARFGSRAVTVGTLLFFCTNVLLFWLAFRRYPGGRIGGSPDEAGWVIWLLPGAFYVWVNCFAVVAPVQAWSFANSLFDTRQAKRLFGIIGAGASLGAITGGLLARFLVEPVGGTVNMLLVLAGLILASAGIVVAANLRVRGGARARRRPAARQRFVDSLREIRGSRYLRLIAALVFVMAVATQWTAFQLSLVATERFGDDPDALTAFFGTFNFIVGAASFMIQLLLTGPALRRFGVGVTVLLLPVVLGLGNTAVLLAPAFWTVLLTNGFDQGLRFSLDKSTYELLYLPLPPAQRGAVKGAIDIVISRFADAFGAVLLGIVTGGFFVVEGFGLELRGTAAVNALLIAVWCALAWGLRGEYVRTIHDTIHRHRIDSEKIAAGSVDALTSGVMRLKLVAPDPTEVRLALDLLEGQPTKKFHPSLRTLLNHPAPDVRRRALGMLSAGGDSEIAPQATRMLKDVDVGVRTEALLYLAREQGIDPLGVIEQLGDFNDFSIRAGMAAFLAASGPTRNLDAARALLGEMIASPGPAGARERQEAARLLARVPEELHDLLIPLIGDQDVMVARQAIRSAAQLADEEHVSALVTALGRPDTADDAADALARHGNAIVPEMARLIRDERVAPESRRELPQVLVRIGTADAEHVLIDSLLQADTALRHNIVISLNKLQATQPRVRIDPDFLQVILAAEIAGHYRSYQVLGALRARLEDADPIVQALRHSMEQALERIFRVMKLLFPGIPLHDAYVGVRSSNKLIRANALEFLENVLEPELMRVLLPLLDSQVTVDERIELADKLVGAPLETAEQAIGTLLASQDAWLRSRAVYAVGALRMYGLEGELRKLDTASTGDTQADIQLALHRLAGDAEPEVQAPVPAEIGMGAGGG